MSARTPDQTRGYIASRAIAREIAALTAAADRDPVLVLDQLAAIRHCPRAVAAVGRVLDYGARKHGVEAGSAPTWTAEQHAAHALDHIRNVMVLIDSRDAETGEFDSTHCAARALLAGELVEGGRC